MSEHSPSPLRRPRTVLSPVLAALAAGVLALLVPSSMATASAAAPQTAYVRVAHLVPGFAAVSMTATLASAGGSDPLTLTDSASYGAVSGYEALPVGYYAISVRPVGASPSSPPVLTASLQAVAGNAYTLAGLGSTADAKVTTITDDIERPADGTARVRVINAAVPGASAQVTVAGGAALATDAPWATPTAYTDVPAGSITVATSAGGRTASTPVDLEAGDVYTLLVLDDGKGGVTVRAVTDAAGPTTAPVGGAATGAGGLAPDDSWAHGGMALAGAAVATAGIGGLLLARRPRTGRGRSARS